MHHINYIDSDIIVDWNNQFIISNNKLWTIKFHLTVIAVIP